jgi:hypothetical protein
MDLYDELTKIVDAFEAGKLDYAICGDVALAVHGHPRFTRDIDLLARQDDVDRAMDLLDEIGFSERSGRIPFEDHDLFRTSKIEGTDILTVDILAVSPALQEVWDSQTVFDWAERELRVVSAEGLARMKQMSGRRQDLLDLEKLGFIDEQTEEAASD